MDNSSLAKLLSEANHNIHKNFKSVIYLGNGKRFFKTHVGLANLYNGKHQIKHPRLRFRPKLSYDQTQSSAHPCVPRPKLQGLFGSSSAIFVWTMVWRWSDHRSLWSEKSDHRRIRAHLGLIITSSSALLSDQRRLRAQLGLIITSSSALLSDQRRLRAQLGLIITSSSALGSDQKCF